MVSIFRASDQSQSGQQSQGSQETVIDEVFDYLDCRYLTALEAIWRLFQYNIHYSHPTVERLPIDLPFENNIVFRDSQPLSEIASNPASRRTKLTAWFDLNASDPAAKLLTYPEPTAGDLYYERMLLNSVCGATSFDELQTVNGVMYQTYKEACNAVGMLDDNSEWLHTMQEATASASCDQLRTMFVDILLYSDVADAKELWESCWSYMGDDIIQNMRSAHCNDQLTINTDSLKDYILHKLGDILFLRGYSLQYVNLPTPVLNRPTGFANRLLTEQYSYNIADLRMQVPHLLYGLNTEQKTVLDDVVQSVHSRHSELFFVYGHGGTGKTFVWQAITAVLRSEGRVVLTVASSASIANSYLWSSCRLLKLNVNMRLLIYNGRLSDRAAIAEFADWLLSVGDGSALAIPLYNSNEADWIRIPDRFLVDHGDDKQQAIIAAVYADLHANFHNDDYLRVRAIVTPKNDAENSLNDAILTHIPGEQFDYLSHDTVQGADNISEDLQTMYPTDILNSITTGSLPCHKLSLKVGVPVKLLRNMDQSKGLCNGTRLVITRLGVRIMHARIITGSGSGTTVQIPRIVFLHEDERLPFIFMLYLNFYWF
ncbi:hypothetical protein LUZ63_019969 [Rhynchospora breviuscula]|uniref:ATP-dependent DNA helicase n=1 Tax=Rhynchospora breviuscula TaxID=2022672 RepID=A0A9Q0C7I3_9POAL|nr:hypothetical protein LUZ63_019969 [Rhynchospora breviuscula]